MAYGVSSLGTQYILAACGFLKGSSYLLANMFFWFAGSLVILNGHVQNTGKKEEKESLLPSYPGPFLNSAFHSNNYFPWVLDPTGKMVGSWDKGWPIELNSFEPIINTLYNAN